VPGKFSPKVLNRASGWFAMGPGIKQGLRLMGFEASVYDVAPTILQIYRVEPPK
jgi:predicted AlkP superfamily phosphohydrolase/phosphomutase